MSASQRCSSGSSGPCPCPQARVQVRTCPGIPAARPPGQSQTPQQPGEGHPGSRASAIQATPVPGPSGVCPLVSHHVHTAQAPGSCPLPTTPYPPPRQSLLLMPTGQHSRDGRWGLRWLQDQGLVTGSRGSRQVGSPRQGEKYSQAVQRRRDSSRAASPQASVQPKRGGRARGVGRATRISSPRHRSAEALRAVSLMAEQLPARSPLAWGQHPSSGTRASPTGDVKIPNPDKTYTPARALHRHTYSED